MARTASVNRGHSRAQSDTALGRKALVWMHYGLCRDMDPDFFFPTDAHGVVAAKQVCAQCPAQVACLDYAMEMRLDHGVWGGASERERRNLRRARRRKVS